MISELQISNPQIAEVLQNPEAISKLPVPEASENVQIYDHWEKAAKWLLNNLWKINEAVHFHFPVDWKAWNLHDYPEIVKNPVDFTSIKEKLGAYKYKSLQEFVDDVQLVFTNCILYNGENNVPYGAAAAKMRLEFEKAYEALNMDYYV